MHPQSAGQGSLFELPAPGRRKVIISWGGGVDSTTILTRFLLEPHLRDFELDDVTVVIALVGAVDEYERTAAMARDHVLPMLARHNVLTAQVARGGDYAKDGYRVLEETRTPTRLRRETVTWTFYHWLLRRGILPMTASRACSEKAKHFALDRYIAQLTAGAPYRHMIGFEIDEQPRANRDLRRATALRAPEHPLISWGYDRQTCLHHLERVFGVRDFPRSCCSYCPFQYTKKGVGSLVARWEAEPAAAARALFLEHVALAMNPRMKLFKDKSAEALVRDHLPRLHGALELFTAMRQETAWRVYEVRRLFPSRPGAPGAKGRAVSRSVLAASAEGSRADALADLARIAHGRGIPVAVDEYGLARAVLCPQQDIYPSTEAYWVVAPAVVEERQGEDFEQDYGRVAPGVGGLVDLADACA